MAIDVRASHAHYLHHILPVWEALPAEARGNIYVDFPAPPELGALPANALPSGTPGPVIVAGFDDLRHIDDRPVVMMEHGCGQTYTGDPTSLAARNPSYAGGSGRHGVVLFLVPNEYAAAANRRTNPDVPVEIIGSPRLAHLQTIPVARSTDKPTVAFSFHWDCPVVPESRSTFGHWAPAIERLAAEGRYNLLGHAHPRLWRNVKSFYTRWGVEPVQHFDEVIQRADVYACDNSSTMYEFAAVRGPVVVLDGPLYRRHIEHGLRFWDAANIGPRILEPALLSDAIDDALKVRPWPGADAILSRVFPAVEEPATVAANAVMRVVDQQPATRRVAASFPRMAPYIPSDNAGNRPATIPS